MPQFAPALSKSHPAFCDGPLLYSAENLSVYHAREKPKQGASHNHDDIQIALPLSGPFSAAWETAVGQLQRQIVHPGTLSINASRQPHAIRVDRETELAVVWLPSPFLIRTAEEMAVSEPVEIAHVGEVQDTLLQQLCLALLLEVRQNSTPAQLYLDAMANLLAAHLLRHHSTRARSVPETTGGLSPRKLRLVLTFVHEHLDQDIALADLAVTVGLSASHLGTLFRQSVGQTPYQYVLAQRIERAKGLLCAGRLSLGEIALQVGFCDQSQFTRQFKHLVGMTPRAFVKAVS